MFDCIYSLGSHCVTSGILKKYELRKFSGFFDYLFVHKSDNFIDILEDNFEHILDLKNHSPIPRNHPLHEKLKRVSIYNKFDDHEVVTFTHHNLLDLEIYNHYIRAKNRFLKTKYFNTLFVYTSYHRFDRLDDEKRLKIVGLLKEKYQCVNFHVLFIELEENYILKKQYKYVKKGENYSVFSLNVHKDSYTGLIFNNDFDNENYINIIYDNFQIGMNLIDKAILDSCSIS